MVTSQHISCSGEGRPRTRERTGGAAASSARPWWPENLSPPSPALQDLLPERGVAPMDSSHHQGSRVAPSMVALIEEEDTMVVPVEEELQSR
jgi:hypothetical protein